jgi:hypothetical protein
MNAPAVWLDVHPRLQVSSPVERNALSVGDLSDGLTTAASGLEEASLR